MPEDKENEKEKALAVPESAQLLIDEAIDNFFDVDIQDMQTVTEERLENLDQKQAAENYEPLKLALESMWNYSQALNGLMISADFEQAATLLEGAASGFDQLGLAALRDLCIGMGAYSEAVLDLRQMNIAQARDRFQAMEEYLEKAGKFSSKFKPLIDHMKPELLFTTALPPLLQLDFPTAQTLFEEAYNAAHKVAETYYSDEDLEKALFQGMAHIYRAYPKLIKSYYDLQQFDYDLLVADNELLTDARMAYEVLNQAKQFSESARILYCLAETAVPLQEVMKEIAHIMKKVFDSTFTPKLMELQKLRNKVQRARESATKAGPAAVAMVRYCELITNQIKNLERLGRPTKKDFGAYSGLVAAGIFIILLPLVAWVNANFNVGINAKNLITSCIVLALIAGFGFGALRFKTLIFPARKSGESG